MLTWLFSLIAWLIPMSSPFTSPAPVEPDLWTCQNAPDHPYSISWQSICVDRGGRGGHPSGH